LQTIIIVIRECLICFRLDFYYYLLLCGCSIGADGLEGIGMNDILPKPFTQDGLLDMLEVFISAPPSPGTSVSIV